jgi:hypothetical protein
MPVRSRRGSGVLSWFPVVVLMLLTQALAGCGDSGASTPSAPGSPSSPSAASTPRPDGALTAFTDPATGFSTTDLRDVQEQIVQLNSVGELIWTADGTRLPGYHVSHPFADGRVTFIEGKICPEACAFEVRFGTREGDRRAYLTVDHIHSNPGTLVDVEVAGGALIVTETDVYPPGTLTLSGVVSEMTARGQTPVEGAEVWRSVDYGWRFATTDANGFYLMPGLYDGTGRLVSSKEGYRKQETDVAIHGDTRYDVELVRQ